ncbi:TetR/AcrR family transcriptional regulator [Rhizobium sp. CNPSo 4039]|uniref:TetR/AcrR family transcriptional regulator n=1 Tax=Rhizobium sp. CNPSo 4039 TaxID=3021409 RepID=UPI00254B3F0A|nr:TetR/AcrR family transcriptional regulator [Rhizobium sp. CNPSo 4039]MDK4717513.1 TetR/AcrR family transcriptional regulator [Rhizobium sp. CNPSo 4039]
MSSNAREDILEAAKKSAQAHGYGGLSMRDLAAEVGIKAASLYYHFPSKAELATAVAKRYWEDAAADLEKISHEKPDPVEQLRSFPETFRKALENENRMCLCSFMGAEYDELPDPLKKEVQTFADVNVAWLQKALVATGTVKPETSEAHAKAVFAAVAGAQLMARSRADIALYDALIESYRAAGLLPA